MMKKIYKITAILAALFLTMPVFAEQKDDPNIVTSKKAVENADGTYTLTLETYVKGSHTATQVPVDIVCVVDLSGSMDESFTGAKNRLAALKTALTSFANTVYNNATLYNVNHKIAIYGYSESLYKVQESLLPMTRSTNLSTITTNINNMRSHSGTDPHYAMSAAYSVLNNRTEKTYQKQDGTTADRGQIVLFFTDGFPGDGESSKDRFTEGENNITEANRTIAGYTYTDFWGDETKYYGANDLKNLGAKIYSIGIHNICDPTADINFSISDGYTKYYYSKSQAMNAYMHFVSSNFGVCANMEAPDRSKVPTNKYYFACNDAQSLTNIFESIADDISTPLHADNSAVVLDIMTNYFKLPEGTTTANNNIKVYTCDVVSPGTDTTDPVWKKKAGSTEEDWVDCTSSVHVYVNDDSKIGTGVDTENDFIEVSGFDYAENYVGKEYNGTTFSKWHAGKKLIIQFTIEKDPANTGGVELPTNDAKSGIYVKDEETGEYIPAENYEQPLTYLPYLKVIKEGLAEGQNAIFTIVGKNASGVEIMNATVMLSRNKGQTDDPYVVIKLPEVGNFTVTEISDWAWDSSKIQCRKESTAYADGNTLTQTITHQNTWTKDNCYINYYFKNTYSTNVKHDETFVTNNLKDKTKAGRDQKSSTK